MSLPSAGRALLVPSEVAEEQAGGGLEGRHICLTFCTNNRCEYGFLLEFTGATVPSSAHILTFRYKTLTAANTFV